MGSLFSLFDVVFEAQTGGSSLFPKYVISLYTKSFDFLYSKYVWWIGLRYPSERASFADKVTFLRVFCLFIFCIVLAQPIDSLTPAKGEVGLAVVIGKQSEVSVGSFKTLRNTQRSINKNKQDKNTVGDLKNSWVFPVRRVCTESFGQTCDPKLRSCWPFAGYLVVGLD